jgi:hypothetical protein
MGDYDGVLRAVWGVTYKTVVERLVDVFDTATPSDIEAGAQWYPQAHVQALQMADESGYDVERCASVIAHLSVRKRWTENVIVAHAVLVDGKDHMPGQMAREMGKALAVRNGEVDPIGSLGPKTRRFALNILGDREVVTVDVWALRGAGLDERFVGRKGAYDAVEAAYQAAALRRGVEPPTMQATVWVVTRGGRREQPALF